MSSARVVVFGEEDGSSSDNCSEALVEGLPTPGKFAAQHATLLLQRPSRGPGVVPLEIQLACHREDDLRTVLGRGNNANVFIYAAEHPSFVSRDHAEFFYESGAWQVADLASVNGVFVLTKANKSRVVKVGREGCALQFGDRVFFGNPQHSFFVEYKFCQSPTGVVAAEAAAAATTVVEEDQVANVAAEVDLVPRDIWLFRILPFLDVASLAQCMQCCVVLRDTVVEAMRHLTTLRWKYEWNTELLPQFLHHRVTGANALSLYAQGCLRMRDAVLDSISQSLGHRLVVLDLSGTPSMSAMSMGVLAQHCGQSLRKLLLRGCKRIGFPNWNWIANLPALEHLDLCCTGCSDLTIRLLCSPKLRWIELGFMAGNHVHPSVTDAALQLLTSKCPLIEGIDLRGCKRLTDGGIRRYCQQQGTRMQSLVLHSCDVGDDTLAAIATSCPNLHALDIHRCIRVSNTGVQSLQLLEGIRRLDLSNLNISDVGLLGLALALCCVRLEELDLRTCKLVTGVGVLALVRSSCHTLQYLDLNGCNQVTPAHVLDMAAVLRPGRRFKCLEIGGRDDDAALRHAWTRQDVHACKQTFYRFGAVVHATFDALVTATVVEEEETDDV